ncbi:MAG: DUF2851 family protein, partial [Chloroflexota bacterium]|nr:DUF2851 family protein [Chloroflexota bacterium]
TSKQVMQLPLIAESSPEYGSRPRLRELAMSAAWHGGLTRSAVTTHGQRVDVVFGGNWSHGFGPDFAGAMLDFGDGGLRTGDVEIHLGSSDWARHGHHLDPRYNSVILHVVSRADGLDARREDGAVIPTVVLDIPDAALFAIDQELPEIWSTLGHSVCAEDVARREPARLRAAILGLGDRLMSERVARFEGELTVEPLSSVLMRGLFDAFGYSQNREPMRAIFDLCLDSTVWPHSDPGIESWTPHAVAGALLGTAGFLPLAPGDAHFAGLSSEDVSLIERSWSRNPGQTTLAATTWTRARTRPANHPALRLMQLARLLATTHGQPATSLLGCIRDGEDVPGRLRDLTGGSTGAGLGAGRATSIAASVVLPVAMAHARHLADPELEDAVSRAWAALPRSEWSRPARRGLEQAVGDARIGTIGERAIQGLIHLDRTLCTPRRCFECPIATEVIRDRQRQRVVEPAAIQSILPT